MEFSSEKVELILNCINAVIKDSYLEHFGGYAVCLGGVIGCYMKYRFDFIPLQISDKCDGITIHYQLPISANRDEYVVLSEESTVDDLIEHIKTVFPQVIKFIQKADEACDAVHNEFARTLSCCTEH